MRPLPWGRQSSFMQIGIVWPCLRIPDARPVPPAPPTRTHHAGRRRVHRKAGGRGNKMAVADPAALHFGANPHTGLFWIAQTVTRFRPRARIGDRPAGSTAPDRGAKPPVLPPATGARQGSATPGKPKVQKDRSRKDDQKDGHAGSDQPQFGVRGDAVILVFRWHRATRPVGIKNKA